LATAKIKMPVAPTPGIVVTMATTMPMMPTAATPVAGAMLVIAVTAVLAADKPVVPAETAMDGDDSHGSTARASL